MTKENKITSISIFDRSMSTGTICMLICRTNSRLLVPIPTKKKDASPKKPNFHGYIPIGVSDVCMSVCLHFFYFCTAQGTSITGKWRQQNG